ncbi:Iron-regulated heparin binding hemagglutinin HbhA (Adhesin) [Actinokineospora spheciospongiae]|uniref:Iron-regulated heparin binding hemagglutinin HbhA (Adhesin) n=1 Tax=Actinokineospora spheciospongiae TaxID=909613 RepID=W7ID79_9PSEU|nr:hypothetical protein [Actinokineospora spheciospongiae]EWC58523.1 Iron-regulated heparin binding hemagglutinin HbhA (Adhesin) [Actinokineospora spheciospongiae]
MTTTEKPATEKTTLPEPVRTPLLAVLGAGDYAAKAVAEAFARAKGRAESTVEELPGEVAGLRGKLDPAELRKLVDAYAAAAVSLYQKLAEHGEDALGKLREQPQVKQLEDALALAQLKAGDVAGDARVLTEDLLAKVTRKTRAAGEKAASVTEDLTERTALATQELAEEVAEAVEDAGAELAHEVRTTSRKAADKADPARKPAATTAKPAATGTAKPATAKPAAKPTTDK